jgi:hypothetical protein
MTTVIPLKYSSHFEGGGLFLVFNILSWLLHRMPLHRVAAFFENVFAVEQIRS